jgi:hypothetical protein
MQFMPGQSARTVPVLTKPFCLPSGDVDESVRSMRVRWLLPGLILAVVVFAACTPPQLRDPQLLQDTSLITSEPCAIPCWRGITPGETAWDEALTIIREDATLENVQLQEDDNTSAAVAEFQQRSGTACCRIFTEDGETVDLLFLRTAPTLTLGEVIETQGEPIYAVGSPFADDQAVMNLIYPEKSTVVYAFVGGESGALSASSEIIAMLYMSPADMETLIQTSPLHTWEGYAPYTTYGDENYEVTPSITLTPTEAGG